MRNSVDAQLPILKVCEGCWRINSFHLRELPKSELRVLDNTDNERKFLKEIHNKRQFVIPILMSLTFH